MDVNAQSLDMLGEMDLMLCLMLQFSSNQQKAAIYSRQEGSLSLSNVLGKESPGTTHEPTAPV